MCAFQAGCRGQARARLLQLIQSPFCRVTFLPDDAKPLSNIGVMIGECGSEKIKWTTPQTPEAPTGLNCHLLGLLVPKHLRARFPRPDFRRRILSHHSVLYHTASSALIAFGIVWSSFYCRFAHRRGRDCRASQGRSQGGHHRPSAQDPPEHELTQPSTTFRSRSTPYRCGLLSPDFPTIRPAADTPPTLPKCRFRASFRISPSATLAPPGDVAMPLCRPSTTALPTSRWPSRTQAPLPPA